MVVVVVPALTKCDQCQEKVVAGIILGLKISSSPNMSERVDGVGTVVAKHSRNEKAPNQGLGRGQAKTWEECRGKISNAQHQECRGNRRHMVVSIQPDQFWEFHPILDQTHSDWGGFLAQEPPAVRLPKAMLLGRVGIQMCVRV